MNILVCIKQVRDPERSFVLDDEQLWIREDQNVSYVMSPYDEYALEEALRIKEALLGTVVDVITVGPERASEVIRRALGMGADNGIHTLTSSTGFQGPFAVASAIAKSVSQKKYDLYLTGVMSADLNQALVGPMLAELMSLPIATAVVERRLSEDLRTVTVQRELEGGLRGILEMSLPAVLTIQSGINTPRYPTLSNMLRAKKQPLEIIDLKNQPTNGSRQELIRLRSPEKTRQGLLLEGTQREKARQLIEILQAKALL